MEVIKIPWEHVDCCLFFRPGRDGGELPGRCTVLSARRTFGQSVREKEDVIKEAKETREQMWERRGMSGV